MPVAIQGLEFGLDKDQYQTVVELNQAIWDGRTARQRREEAKVAADVREGQVEVNLYALRKG